MCPRVKHLISFNNRFRSSSLSLQIACKNNFGENIVEGRKEGKKGGRGKKVVITLFYDGGRFQF